MNQAERNAVRSYMRKLARIAQELNELAFQLADFESANYKNAEEITLIEHTVPADSPADEASAPQQEDGRLQAFKSKLEDINRTIAAELRRPEINQTKVNQLKRSRKSLMGHITRLTQKNKKDAWKSQVK